MPLAQHIQMREIEHFWPSSLLKFDEFCSCPKEKVLLLLERDAHCQSCAVR